MSEDERSELGGGAGAAQPDERVERPKEEEEEEGRTRVYHRVCYTFTTIEHRPRRQQHGVARGCGEGVCVHRYIFHTTESKMYYFCEVTVTTGWDDCSSVHHKFYMLA